MQIYNSLFDPSIKLIYFNGLQYRPNLVSYLAMRQDYSPDPIYLKYDQFENLTEEELGRRVWDHAVRFNHFGVMEHSGLVFNVVGFPHDVPMQHRTHRVGVSFDVMSQRYTGKHFYSQYQKDLLTATGNIFSDSFIKKYFYLDIMGQSYSNREGTMYVNNREIEQIRIAGIRSQLIIYCQLLEKGVPEERARRDLPQGIRQHYVFSCNPRSLEHLLDVRTSKDVQFEFRLLSELFMQFYQVFNPVMAEKYQKKRYGKNRLAP